MRIHIQYGRLSISLAALFCSLPSHAQDIALRNARLPPRCNACTDSTPSSLGADGWAAATGAVTGGCGASPWKIHHVHSRSQLVAALMGSPPRGVSGCSTAPDDAPKIIYVDGPIDLNVDDHDVPLTEDDYLRLCNDMDHATYYDPVTRDQTGSGGFFGAYKAAFDPNTWIRQSLDPADNRPPALFGSLEDGRRCLVQQQAARVVIPVGSNTSIIGTPGADARIIHGTLQLGYLRTLVQPDPADPTRTVRVLDTARNYKAENIVIRNIRFADAFDMFPAWDPKDSFNITITNANGCQAAYDAATDSGPHRCVYRGGRWNAAYDNITIENAERVWIDHDTFTDEPALDKLWPPVFAAPFNEATQKVQHHDGQVDIVVGATLVTLTQNLFTAHDKTNLLGASDAVDVLTGYGPGKIDVTFHHNYWLDTIQRMPRVRMGRTHVYNNLYDLDWRATADYRLGDSWVAGTAGKLFAENNLFNVHNDSVVPASKIAAYSSTSSNEQRCIDAGFAPAQCGTYFYESGTVVTTVTATGATTAVLDIFAALKVKQESNANNALLRKLDPADPAVFWLPQQSYAYAAMPVSTADEQAALQLLISASAGAGHL